MEFPFESKYQADQRTAAEAAQTQRQAAAANPEEVRAQALFGNSMSQPKPAPAHRSLLSNQDDVLAARLFDSASQAKPHGQGRELDVRDDHAVAARLYDPQTTYRESLPDRLVGDWAVIDPEQREALLEEIEEYRELAGDLKIGNGQGEELVDLQESLDQVTYDQADAWRAESEQSLVRESCGIQAGERLADARLLVSQNPRLRAFLDDGARRNHPRVVQMVTDLARREKFAGRLTRGR